MTHSLKTGGEAIPVTNSNRHGTNLIEIVPQRIAFIITITIEISWLRVRSLYWVVVKNFVPSVCYLYLIVMQLFSCCWILDPNDMKILRLSVLRLYCFLLIFASLSRYCWVSLRKFSSLICAVTEARSQLSFLAKCRISYNLLCHSRSTETVPFSEVSLNAV